MSVEIQMRPVEPDDFPGIRKLFETVWGEERDERYDRMRFLQTAEELPAASVAMAGTDYAGFFTLWPMRLTDGRRILPAGQAMDVMTDARFRGKGIFPALARLSNQLASERGMKLLYGAPNEAIFETYLKRLSWAQPADIIFFVRPLSLRRSVKFGEALDPLLAILPRGRTKGADIRDRQPADEDLTTCISASETKRGAWRVHRTPDWYRFRYQPAGKFDYRWSTVWRDGKLAAFSVWGLDIAGQGRFRRANLADAVGIDEAARRTAIAAAVQAAKRSGANYIAAAATSAWSCASLKTNGFLRYRRSPLIARTLDADSFDANPFLRSGWDLFGADFDFF